MNENKKRVLAAIAGVIYGLAVIAVVTHMFYPGVSLGMLFWFPFPLFPLPLPPLWFPG